jgi:hypothetical protein
MIEPDQEITIRLQQWRRTPMCCFGFKHMTAALGALDGRKGWV